MSKAIKQRVRRENRLAIKRLRARIEGLKKDNPSNSDEIIKKLREAYAKHRRNDQCAP